MIMKSVVHVTNFQYYLDRAVKHFTCQLCLSHLLDFMWLLTLSFQMANLSYTLLLSRRLLHVSVEATVRIMLSMSPIQGLQSLHEELLLV